MKVGNLALSLAVLAAVGCKEPATGPTTAEFNQGREALKLQQTGSSMVTGEELPAHKIPLLGRFYGDAKSQTAETGTFYDNVRKLNVHENNLKGRAKDGLPVDVYLRKNPEAKLYQLGNQAERRVQEMKRAKRKLVEQKAPREQIREIEANITEVMRRFNQRVREAERPAR